MDRFYTTREKVLNLHKKGIKTRHNIEVDSMPYDIACMTLLKTFFSEKIHFKPKSFHEQELHSDLNTFYEQELKSLICTPSCYDLDLKIALYMRLGEFINCKNKIKLKKPVENDKTEGFLFPFEIKHESTNS